MDNVHHARFYLLYNGRCLLWRLAVLRRIRLLWLRIPLLLISLLLVVLLLRISLLLWIGLLLLPVPLLRLRISLLWISLLRITLLLWIRLLRLRVPLLPYSPLRRCCPGRFPGICRRARRATRCAELTRIGPSAATHLSRLPGR